MNNAWKTSEFYCRIKTRKWKLIDEAIFKNRNETILNILKPNNLNGRSTVAGPNSPTQALSFLIEKIIKPIVPFLTRYIKQLPRTLNYEATLYSRDIESSYTSMPIVFGLEAISYWLNSKSNLILNRFSKHFILGALEFILRNNNFSFCEIIYNQTEGTPMGNKCVPPYAYLVVGYKEETKLFSIELPKFVSTKEIKIIKKVLRQYKDIS